MLARTPRLAVDFPLHRESENAREARAPRRVGRFSADAEVFSHLHFATTASGGSLSREEIRPMTEQPPNPDEFTDTSPHPANDAELAVFCDMLQERGITEVVISYSGSGDEGAVEDIVWEPGGTSIPDLAERRLSDLAEEYCPPGYQNDMGGYGTLTIYPAEGLAELEHCDYYEDTEDMQVGDAEVPEAILSQLKEFRVSRLTAHFDGYGDSGQFEDIDVLPEGIEIDHDLREQIEDFLVDLLPGGWEINDGSFGSFTIDVESGELTPDAYGRVTEESEPKFTRWKWRQ